MKKKWKMNKQKNEKMKKMKKCKEIKNYNFKFVNKATVYL